MKKAFIFGLLTIMVMSRPGYAEEAKVGQEDFITSTVKTVCDKVNGYVTGQRDILDWSLIKPESKGRAPDELDKKLNSVTIRSGPITPAGKTQ